MSGEELRALAEAATPGGPWVTYDGDSFVFTPDDDVVADAEDGTAAFIAAANPTAVLALLDDIAAAEQRGREDNADHGMCYVSGSRALEAKLASAWSEGHASGRNYQGDGWNSDAHDPERDNPYRAALDPQ